MAMRKKYLELRGLLEKQFSGLPPNSMLPGEQELSRTLGVSRPTVRLALAELVKEGKIEKRCGIGNFLTGSSKVISKELFFICSDFLTFHKTIQEFCEEATRRHYISSIIPLGGDRTTQNRIIASVMSRNPAGIALLPFGWCRDLEEFGTLHESGIPSVYLLYKPDAYEENLIVNHDGEAFSTIVSKLYEEGYRKFAFYGSEGHIQFTTDTRKEGFLEGARKCRLKIPEERICVRGVSREQKEAFFDLFRGDKRPEVVCSISDYSASEFLNGLKERNIERGNLLLTGFDNNHVIHWFIPDFITGEPNQIETGRALADLLIRQVENPAFAKRQISISPIIVDNRKR